MQIKLQKEARKEDMRAVASACEINVTDMGNKDKLKKPAKYLAHSTNLTVGADPSAEASRSANATPEMKTFNSMQNSMTSLNQYLNFVTPKLLAMTSEILTNEIASDQNTSIQSTSDKNNNKKDKQNELKVRVKITREAWKFAKESGNAVRATKKQKLAEDLEDELESIL